MPIPVGINRTGTEEKGQMNIRSLQPYLSKRALPDGTVCKGCGIVYRNKRWQIDSTANMSKGEVLCPACLRDQGHDPAGVVTLSGPYLAQHREDIVNTIKQQEKKHREKNPLGRIMEMKEEDGVMVVTTTDDKLAQKIGREVYKSQRGELHYQWSHDLRMVRVEWKR